jgi:hypothetical protein
MARARNIKPSFFINEELVECSFATRLLFIGLWTLADREGRLEDKPKKIKMALFAADNLDIEHSINELVEHGFIVRYEVKGEKYIQVLAFKKHQNPHRDEKASTIPAQYSDDADLNNCDADKEKHSASTVQAQCKDDVNTVAIGLIPDSLLLKQTQEQKTTARLCQIFKDNNISGFSSIHPVFQELIKQGVAPEEFEFAAKNHQGKKFNYIVGVIKNIRSDAANLKLSPKEDKDEWRKGML